MESVRHDPFDMVDCRGVVHVAEVRGFSHSFPLLMGFLLMGGRRLVRTDIIHGQGEQVLRHLETD
jgi:hypothetical protein